MGYTIFTLKKDPAAPRFDSCYTSCFELMDVCREVGILFNEPRVMVRGLEVGKFNHDDPRLQEVKVGLEKYLLSSYIPSGPNPFAGVVLEPPFPEEALKGMAFSIKSVVDYALENKVKLFVNG